MHHGQVGIISPRDYPILGLTIDPLTTFTSQSYIQIKQNQASVLLVNKCGKAFLRSSRIYTMSRNLKCPIDIVVLKSFYLIQKGTRPCVYGLPSYFYKSYQRKRVCANTSTKKLMRPAQNAKKLPGLHVQSKHIIVFKYYSYILLNNSETLSCS